MTSLAAFPVDLIEQSHVDLAADDLMSRGIRPTVVKVQAIIGGERGQLCAFLENWARRLHCRITGRVAEEFADRASTEKSDLQLMREADAINKKSLRARQARMPRESQEVAERAGIRMRRSELEAEIERAQHKLSASQARRETMSAALQVVEQGILTAETRIRGLTQALASLPH